MPRKRKTVPGPEQKSRAQVNIDWVHRYCRVPEGKDVGKPLVLRPWQQDVFRRIYDNPHGTRRAILSFGRKNAKTTLASLIVLIHLCGKESRPNAQIFSAAQSRDQAGILFNLAAKIARMSPEISANVGIRDTAKQLYCPPRGTLYRALSAEVPTAYGLSPALIVHDELGQVRGPRSELYDALETATGAQAEPLSIIISTQAPTDNDLLSVLIDDAMAGHDPRTVVSLYTAPIDDDPYSVETIRKANPALGDFLNEQEVLDMADAARRMPARESEYRNLVLNQRVESTSPFISRDTWKACGAAPKSIDNVPVYGGLDLSEVKDLTALVLMGKVDGAWQVHPTFWLPGDGIRHKSRTDQVPYDVWSKAGKLVSAPGKAVDYEYVAAHLMEVFDRYDIKSIAFDKWNFKHLRPWLLKAGFTEERIAEAFVEFGQGFQSMSPALRDLEGELLNQRVAHGNHPVLNMCADCAVVQRDPAGNRKLNKAKSTGRIDGMVALAMAMGVATSVTQEEPREYQLMVL